MDGSQKLYLYIDGQTTGGPSDDDQKNKEHTVEH